MKLILFFTILLILISCRNPTEIADNGNKIHLIVPDTTNNKRAAWALEAIEYYSKISNQLGISVLRNGADSLEIRMWYSFSFINEKELYIIKFQDRTCSITYCRYYLKGIDYNNDKTNKNRNPMTTPIVDSSFSKTVLVSRANLKKGDLNKFELANIWNLSSQSELNIPDSVGYTDCETYSIEVADNKRYKFLTHHCPKAYWERLKLKGIKEFINYCDGIRILANNNKAFIPYTFNNNDI
jgi:hypothetical protein